VPERLLILSDLKLDHMGQIAPNNSDDWMNGREGQFVLTNAQNKPIVHFDTGDVSAGGSGMPTVRAICACSYLAHSWP
jgi:FtsP/CotA-like multicopper oxidase with cupredoxin domain